jgi:hypothetical protein
LPKRRVWCIPVSFASSTIGPSHTNVSTHYIQKKKGGFDEEEEEKGKEGKKGEKGEEGKKEKEEKEKEKWNKLFTSYTSLPSPLP